MKKLLLILCCIASISSVSGQTLEELVAEAGTMFNNQNYPKAIELYSKAIAINTANDTLYVLRGNVHYEAENYQNAYDDFSKSLQLNPQLISGYINRAQLLLLLKYPQKAIDDANKGLSLIKSGDKEHLKVNLLVIRGSAYIDLGTIEKAYADFKEILNLTKAGMQGYRMLALFKLSKAAIALGDDKEGLSYLEQGVKEYPDFIAGYVNLVYEYGRVGEYQKAVDAANQGIAHLPYVKTNADGTQQVNEDVTVEDTMSYPVLLNNRGYAKYKLADYAGALEDINHSLSLLPGNAYAYRNRALVYIAQHKIANACEELQMALDLNYTSTYGDEVQQLVNKHCNK